MTRTKAYQDTSPKNMGDSGLQRSIDCLEAEHITTRQYYRDLMQQMEQ
ncbi:hypothetical protein [Bacteroides eggerthii]